jgi:magnesium transporter
VLDPVTKGYLTRRPDAAAISLLRLEDRDMQEIFEAMPRPLAANVLEHMPSASASRCLANLSNKTISEILAQMPIPASVAVLRHMHHDQVKELLERMPRAKAVRIRLGLRYSETVVGAYVDANVITLKPEQHVSEALRLYRQEGQYTRHIIYVLDEQRHLAGQVHLDDLLSARDRSIIKRIMRPVPAVLNTRATLQSVAKHPAWLTSDSLPVINRNNIYQGVFWRDKVMHKDQHLINNVTEHNELESTRAELADIFWMAVGALFVGGAAPAERNEEED